MTQYWDVNEDGGLDVWDHEGEQIVTNAEWCESWIDYPSETLHYLYESMDGSQPSAYNQQLIADVVFGQIERGNPNTE